MLLSSKKVRSGLVAAILVILLSTGTPVYASPNESAIDAIIAAGEDAYVGTLDGNAAQSLTVIDGRILGADITNTDASALRKSTFVGKVTAHWPHKSGSQACGHVTWELKWGSAPKLRTTAELWSYSNGSWV